MNEANMLAWVQVSEALVSTGIMIEKEFATLFKQYNHDMTPEQQRAALAAIRDEAARRKALAQAQVDAVAVKIAAETPSLDDGS